MNEQQILEMLRSLRILITDTHAVLTNWDHSSTYLDADALYPHTGSTSFLCNLLAQSFRYNGVQVVVAPQGANALSQWTAHHLSELIEIEVLAAYTERDGDGFVLRRGYDKLVTGKRVLVVDDTFTTGTTVKRVAETVRASDGNVVGVGVLFNRGGVTSEDVYNAELTALLNIPLISWPEDECPLCRNGAPVNTRVGKGAEFLAKKQRN